MSNAESPITISYVKTRDKLYHRYPREMSPQRALVTLRCETGALSAAYDPEIGPGVPEHVATRRVLRWVIPALTADAANKLLDQIRPLAETIVAGYSREWDGHNHVGRYTDEADAAIEAVEALILKETPDAETLEVWDAADWFGALGRHAAQRRELGITAQTTDEELAEIVEREETNAEGRLIENLARHLTKLRDEALDEASE